MNSPTNISWHIPYRVKRYLVKGAQASWSLLPLEETPTRWRKIAGRAVHRVMCRYQDRNMSLYTRFFRNPPQLDALAKLVSGARHDRALHVAVLGSSTGAEVYSAAWTLRTAIPDLDIEWVGVDISETAIATAIQGLYSPGSHEVNRVPGEMLDRVLDRVNGMFKVKESLRSGVRFLKADAGDEHLIEAIGPQDVVIANNFLIHLQDRQAQACLFSIEKLLVPGGLLLLWGIDLDLKTRAVRALRLEPVLLSLEDIYAADRTALEAWPLKWWGLEPMDRTRPDWLIRYCTLFRKPQASSRTGGSPSSLH